MINTALLPADKDPMGAAIADYFKRHKADRLRVFSSQFDEDEIPVEELFRTEKQMPLLERTALQMATGKILDVGAGTGRYSVQLAGEGYDVTAVELVKYNLGILKSKKSSVKAYQGNALNLSRFEADQFDMVLVFGPMYHLYTKEDKVKALKEAKRVVKPGGIILVAYCMNEYSILTYGFKEGHMKESIRNQKVDDSFHVRSKEEDLYDYVRIEDIDAIDQAAGVKREKLIAADGPANYMRTVLNAMDEETYQLFIQYHLSTCERKDLLGASAHTLDIVRK